MPKIHIGTSGWHYKHWRGTFYPEKLAAKDWLKYYSTHFDTVEINNSFYRLPLESTFTNWQQTVQEGFCFAVKASRLITHIKRIKDVQEPLQTFTDRAKCLQGKLGPILYQLPPGLHRDKDRLEKFLGNLDQKLTHVFEFRHASWMEESVFNLLRKYKAGFCIFDMPGMVSPVVATTGFAYVRFHGKGELYTGHYPDSELADWSRRLQGLSHGLRDLYIYFNNDAGGYAVANAVTMKSFMEAK